jgi:hypothetical protein
VTVTVYFRDSESGPYEILDGPRQSKIGADSLNLDIGWWFPGSDSSLDKVVIDGIEYINSDTGTLPRIMAVNLFITLNSKAVFN